VVVRETSRSVVLSKTKIACEKHQSFVGMDCVDEYFEEGLFHDSYVEVWRCPECGWTIKTRERTDKLGKDGPKSESGCVCCGSS
jgi:rubrerythrin